EESTTPDLVELTRRLVDALNAGHIDAAISLCAPDVVFQLREGAGVFEDRLALRSFAEDWLGAYDEFELGVEEIRDLGNGVVFGVQVQRGKPRGSTGWVHTRYAVVGTWVGGQIERGTAYTDIDQARTAAERLAEERT